MAVQGRHLSHDLAAQAAGGYLFLDEYAGCAPAAAPAPARIGDATTALSDFPRVEVAWCNYDGFLPRKRPRLETAAPAAGGGLSEDQRAGLPPAGTERLLPLPVAVAPFVNARSRRAVAASGTASTSGRVASGATVAASRGLLSSWTHRHGVEIDALVRLEAERMRAALEEARRRHARALLAAVGRAASGRLRASETDLERALRRGAELEEKARQAGAECQAWMAVARRHEAAAAGLRATLDQLLQSPYGAGGGREEGGEAEDAESCCFEDGGASCASRSKLACRSCDACPVCAAAKNGSLHVLVS
uniref:BOI-related E3 ubiquitin-protein ligase 3 n=1 Tax=Zea mays TaxID=4577 RepID=A0A804MGV0_MAIZE